MFKKITSTPKFKQAPNHFKDLDEKMLREVLKQSCKDQMKMIKEAEKIIEAEKKQ